MAYGRQEVEWTLRGNYPPDSMITDALVGQNNEPSSSGSDPERGWISSCNLVRLQDDADGAEMLQIRRVGGKPYPTIASSYISRFTNDIGRANEGKDLLAVKDNIATRQYPTTCASSILRKHRSPFSAEVVTRLQNQKFVSAVVVGKTNMDEFGMGSHSLNSSFGPVSDDVHFPGHSVGGSSGGSAVAVVDKSCFSALGTDTGGSIRLPAAYTGIVGFKPSYGRVSRWGVIPYANSLDTVGFLAANVNLVRNDFDKVNKFDSKDPTSLTTPFRERSGNMRNEDRFQERRRRPRSKDDIPNESAFAKTTIGVPMEYNISELDPHVRAAWEETLQIMQDNGATIVPVSLPNTKHALSAYYVLAPAEATSNLAKYDGVRYGTRSDSRDGDGEVLYSNTRGSGFGDEVKRRIILGSYTLSSEAIGNYFIKAQKIRRLVQRDFDRVFIISNPLRPREQFDLSTMHESIELDDKLGPAQVDFIVCPTAPTRPPTIEQVAKQSAVDTYMADVFTVPASLAGLPAISIPYHFLESKHSLPDIPNFAGIQIIGQFADDNRVLQCAQELERFEAFRSAVTAPVRRRPSLRVDKPWIDQLRKDKWEAMENERRTVCATPLEALKITDGPGACETPERTDAERLQEYNTKFEAWTESKQFTVTHTYKSGWNKLTRFLAFLERVEARTKEREMDEKRPE
ncbi:related to glutamyl-tRNA(Gln) amidotransferase subunit A [Rhynchosporium secalis]|uniref:Glutamyl-tRNA(Gln) amidotransferase subunit A, mitochondrial n=1 Tax=Rhynchosporium secalis TaxID=38038 RepID=A0A1E1MH45_RHYSE|nr:related to glutamyl-tRNA(Gln) amidotransferase subunit A [Rhynchosporium secalis]